MQRQHLWRQHSDEVNGALCARWLPVQGLTRVLKTDLFDEACTGGLYPWLASRARAVVGIDLSHCTAQAARSRHPNLRTITTDVRRLPFADDCVDAIVSNSTLDHFASLGDIVAGLTELHRVLRPGGHLLLTLDNLANSMVALRNALPGWLLARLQIVDYYVGATCGPRRLRQMLGEAGFRRLRSVIDPLVAALHSLPKIAILPLIMIIFGIGDASKVVVIAIGSFFPMLINSAAGVRQIHPIYFEVAENYGASRLRVYARVVLPGSLPLVLTGLRLAMNTALLLAIAVEIVAAQQGLSSMIWFAWETLRTEELYAALVTAALLGIGFNALVQQLIRVLVPWQVERGK